MTVEYKKNMIEANIISRQEEIAGYEINIFNYQYMYDRATDENMKVQLKEGVDSNKREMNKVVSILEALEAQLLTLQ
jgi:predicted transcriptional regulator